MSNVDEPGAEEPGSTYDDDPSGDKSVLSSASSTSYTSNDSKINISMNFASTNSRSLPPKICAMTECFRELDLTFFAITETWLKNDEKTKSEIENLFESEKIRILTRNRGSRGGGVALAYDSTRATFKTLKLPSNRYEILCCEGELEGISRPIAVFCIYLPPKMSTETLGRLCEFMSDSLEYINSKLRDPLVVITGDFNRKNFAPAVIDFPELELLQTDPTRGTSCLDLVYTNFPYSIKRHRVLPPLETNDGSAVSDHKLVAVETDFQKTHVFKKRKITFRPYTQRGEEMFGNLMARTDWSHLHYSDNPAELFRERLDVYVDACFPTKTRTFKSCELPWITKQAQLISRQKKREYKRNRRSDRWLLLERKMRMTLLEGRTEFFNRVKTKVKESKNSRAYFRAVALLASNDDRIKPKEDWNVTDMFPGETDIEVAEKLACYFNRISSEFEPLRQPATPECAIEYCPAVHEISARLKSIRKPRSQVPGDVPPALITKYHDLLSLPLEIVFRRAFSTCTWPPLWKAETVTIIPKCTNPTDLKQLRNLSCTPLFSKVMETFLLDKLKREVPLPIQQFGGIKGSSVDHFLIETWDCILRALEDNRAAVTLASIDFEKAFNRVDHQECLLSAQRMGASPPTLKMIRAFLTERTMSVKVNQAKSSPRYVQGGSPQGSIIANYLFCIVSHQLNNCADSANEIDLNRSNETLDFSANGDSSVTGPDSSASGSCSPITRPHVHDDLSLCSSSDEEEILASDFIYFNPRRRWYDTHDGNNLSSLPTQTTINREFGLPQGWIHLPLAVKVYIDDINSIEKVNTVNAVSTISQDKRTLKVHAPITERYFELVYLQAKKIKMLVNQQKTQMLTISAAVHDRVFTYMRPTVEGKISETVSGTHLKILGFNFNNIPSVSYHISIMCQKFRAKLWSLRKLKRAGMDWSDLHFIYTSVLRPVIEYASVTYGPMLTAEQSRDIERLQLRVMKIVHGNTVSYGTVIEETNLKTLEERRDEKLEKFARKTAANPRFSDRWFPRNPPSGHHIRNPKIYREEKTKTDRLYSSPLFKLRRILNNI